MPLSMPTPRPQFQATTASRDEQFRVLLHGKARGRWAGTVASMRMPWWLRWEEGSAAKSGYEDAIAWGMLFRGWYCPTIALQQKSSPREFRMV